MESELLVILDQFRDQWALIMAQARLLLLPTRLVQIALVLACMAISWVASRWLGRRMLDWMRGLEGRPRWQLRALLILQRRLWLICFVLLSWCITWAMQAAFFFPSRSYILVLVSTLATALLAVALATRLVRNLVLRRLVRWGLWAYVTLHYLGLKDEAAEALDAVALRVGDFRLSALILLHALVVTGALLIGARLMARVTGDRIRRTPQISPSMQVLAIKVMQIGLYGIALVVGMRTVGFDLTGWRCCRAPSASAWASACKRWYRTSCPA